MSDVHEPLGSHDLHDDHDARGHEWSISMTRTPSVPACSASRTASSARSGSTMGVAAAAQVSPETVLIAGIAGAFSGCGLDGRRRVRERAVQHELLAGAALAAMMTTSTRSAAVANSGLFVLGAALPLIPFVFLAGLAAVAASSVMSVVALFTAGALLTRLTGQSPWRSGMRMLLIGGGAGVLGYGVGSLLGVVV
jgi:VIT1/CCC1 family predicted Fe2+/Mn2+ transporter